MATLEHLPSAFTTQVDLGGLMAVLGQHLYSTPVVALRELVQNAHDSLARRRLEDREWRGEGRIGVEGDPVRGILRITDTGAGLTAHEIHTFLATVGVSYTRGLRERTHSEELIGLFGLGFLSAFVLAEEVTVTTTSYQRPDQGFRYRSEDGKSYRLQEVPPRPVGTEVELSLRDSFRHLAESGTLAKVLGKYCVLLSEPVYLAGRLEPLNGVAPPWRRRPDEPLEHPVQLRRRRLAFASLFEATFEPICTVPVEPTGSGDASGLLWVQDGATYGTSDNRNLAVFVRGMLLDDDARDLLPAWAGFVGGVIESSCLTPTASREDLQRDEPYRGVQAALREALVGGLAKVAREDPHAWRRVLTRHNEALLGAALCDPRLFQLLADDLRVPTSQGELPVRSLRVSGKLHLALGSAGGFEEMIFRSLRVPVARGDRFGVAPFLRQWVGLRGGTLIEVGTEQRNRQLFTPETLPDSEVEWLTAQLGDGELVVPARFAPRELPLVVVPDREAELKRRLEADEADERISVAALRLARAFTSSIDGAVRARLYVNLENPSVQALLQAHREARPGAAGAARVLWALKAIMAAGGDESHLDLNEALAQIGRAVQALAEGRAHC
jgi:molecular chaperone HtpG